MSMGFGAGLAGLLGGLGALAVGKLASAAVENLGKAEDNAVALDRLKRTLGDVNVSFGALKAAVDGTAESSRITYAEAGKLGTQYARAGNLSGGELGEECLSQTSLPADAAFVRTGMFSSGPGAV
jgi:hypothetical protein